MHVFEISLPLILIILAQISSYPGLLLEFIFRVQLQFHSRTVIKSRIKKTRSLTARKKFIKNLMVVDIYLARKIRTNLNEIVIKLLCSTLRVV